MSRMERPAFDLLLNLLYEKTPFAFARFNDGEMKAIANTNVTIARGDQKVTSELRSKLRGALEHKQHNYWKGKPCGACFSKQRKVYDQIVDSSYEFQTYAVLFCNNGHWKPFIDRFPAAVQQRKLTWIIGDGQNMEALNARTGMDVGDVVRVPMKNSFECYDELSGMWSVFEQGQVVVMCCGPISRVLTATWFARRPDCTFFDAGSLFDPYTKNLWHSCHKGGLKFCKECNWHASQK